MAGVARAAVSVASGGISEKAMAARDQSSAGGGGSVAGASFMSGVGSRCSSRHGGGGGGSEAGMSMRSGGTGSISGSMQSSVTGLSGDGEPPA